MDGGPPSSRRRGHSEGVLGLAKPRDFDTSISDHAGSDAPERWPWKEESKSTELAGLQDLGTRKEMTRSSPDTTTRALTGQAFAFSTASVTFTGLGNGNTRKDDE